MHFVDQFKALMPTIVKGLRPAIVHGRGNVERDFDAMTPVLLDGFQGRLDDLSEAVAVSTLTISLLTICAA